MFKIIGNAKHGGIWDAAGKRVVKEIKTDNAALAERFKTRGFTVTEASATPKKRNVCQ